MFPAKRVVGEKLDVEADIFTDGHDILVGVLLYRKATQRKWREAPLSPLVNDRYRGSFVPTELGQYVFTFEAWVDRYATWLHDLLKKFNAAQDVNVELLSGAEIVQDARKRADGRDKVHLRKLAEQLRDSKTGQAERVAIAKAAETQRLVGEYPNRKASTTYDKLLPVEVDPPKARFSTWYEMFPRSSWDGTGKHATFKDCEARLDYIASMGFDVLYLPPIHPIGTSFRKGRNNALKATAKDPGSPWAIGNRDGGHTAIHKDLGTPADFRRLVSKAREYGIDVALDVALQCSPDHPYVKAHPEWFRWRPDGTIQYAENPPKKYQDIYPIEFESDEWQELWEELKNIFEHWIEQGVRIFRVDNPHTKPFRFWEWAIAELKKNHPDVIFLSEAFTRPKVMYHLAKSGFTQSYTYFAWRNTKHELIEYMTELTRSEPKYFFRPNFWPNTPDILTEFLQSGNPAAFKLRLALAATLTANYGIYGPAFELMEHLPREHGSEEYLNSEKYEVRTWDFETRPSIRDFIARVNRIRIENQALHSNETLQFHEIQNDQLICYSKTTETHDNVVIVVVNLDPNVTHSAWTRIPWSDFGFDTDEPVQVHDLISDARYLWLGEWNYVELNPYVSPAHIFCVRRLQRTEHDFDYYV